MESREVEKLESRKRNGRNIKVRDLCVVIDSGSAESLRLYTP
jgi:hypothetical protein